MASMLSSTLLPERFRGASSNAAPAGPPSWLNRKITAFLQPLSRVSYMHPIQTVVVVALLASTSYVGPLKESLYEGAGTGLAGGSKADWASLVDGSRTLRTGAETGWKWQSVDAAASAAAAAAAAGPPPASPAFDTTSVDHLALLTLVFADSDLPGSAPPGPSGVPLPAKLSVTHLPPTVNSLASYSQDKTLAYAVPFAQAPELLSAAQEIPGHSGEAEAEAEAGAGAGYEPESESEKKEKRMWIMKAARVNPRSTISQWAHNARTEFLDLLKNAETLDILIMIMGYLSMHLTFVSLFLSMRRMGSNFWLAASVLFSSTFAFLFGLLVTTQMGVPVSVVLLSEGLPFLVVTIGFEKNIVLTRAVLSHAVEHRKPRNGTSGGRVGASPASSSSSSSSSVPASSAVAAARGAGKAVDANTIQYAVKAAIREKGYEIVRDYAIEIVILVLGAASGVQGGLQQFCFLAAWILFFDCLLLFTFYTAILSIKLEINRIKRHVDMRRALEDDGVSRRLAEKVARSNDWPLGGSSAGAASGDRFKSFNSVPTFKVLMVSGFVLVNVLNLCTIPFRNPDSLLPSLSSWARGLGGVVTSPPVDPFKVAVNGLDAILAAARSADRATLVTVLTPIRYQLEYPSVHYALTSPLGGGGGGGGSAHGSDHADGLGYYGGMGGRMVGSLLQSLEDPLLSKWIIVALAMSVALNGYLFNVARWGIKDPNIPDHDINPRDLATAQRFNDAAVSTPTLGSYGARTTPPTPAPTDDEGERRAAVPSPDGAAPPPGSDSAFGTAPASAPASARAPASANRPFDVLEKFIRDKRVHEMSDEEVVAMSLRGKIPGHSLERNLRDFTRAVKVRRTIISRTRATAELTGSLDRSSLPYENYNWERVFGACCENVIGYMPLPVGVAGPIVIDGQSYLVPMATTEGVLVASTSRGSKAINAGGGAVTVLTHDGMTRGPVVSFETLERAGAAKHWLDSDAGRTVMTRAFNSTSNFARLQSLKTALAGTNLFIRFKTTTGDAMGMNMISKGVEHALNVMVSEGGFDDMNIISISGNYCADKKPAALNWIDGRGKGVVAEAIIPADVVRSVLKTDVDTLIELNTAKNYIGSAMAGSIGGFNAHAANMVAAIFIATGQDPAQVVESANCITIMKNLRGSLQISVSMPSLEVGTLGGGTILEPQSAMLDMLGVRGPHPTCPGENARRLARIIAAVTMAGELSLCGAQAAGHLVRAHMAHNRSAPPTRVGTPAPPAGAMTPVGLSMTSTLERASVR